MTDRNQYQKALAARKALRNTPCPAHLTYEVLFARQNPEMTKDQIAKLAENTRNKEDEELALWDVLMND